jgi:hypothetical protein
VGDYTTCLAEECVAKEHEVLKIALNDPFVDKIREQGETLRLGASLPWEQRLKKTKEALAQFSPEVISLQFVCYGFHPRGFCFGLGAKLREVFGKVPLQVMAHELWIGAEVGASKKDRLVGAIQRQGVLSAFKQLCPAVVHTTNAAYQGLLQQNGIAAGRLPLFGAIPIPIPIPDRPDQTDRTDLADPREAWRFVMFGTLHPVWPPAPLLDRLLATGKKLSITHAGNIGTGADLWGRMQRDYGTKIAFERKGELTPEEVAGVFAQTDFGIATTPWELIGKSGSVAAMTEHGLPVVVNRDEVHFRGWRDEDAGLSPLLIKMGRDLGERLAQARRREPRSIREEVAAQFLADLKGAL